MTYFFEMLFVVATVTVILAIALIVNPH